MEEFNIYRNENILMSKGGVSLDQTPPLLPPTGSLLHYTPPINEETFLHECQHELTKMITVTFRPEYHKYTPKYLDDILQRKLIKYAKLKSIRIYLVGELSPNGLWHYHGIVSNIYNKPMKLLSNWFVRNFGLVDVKENIHSPKDLYKYIHKDRGLLNLGVINLL